MANNDYFSHVNLYNETPDDRRIKMGIKVAVSENIAKDISIPFAHEGLMRSAAHRGNILDPNWTQVGIGITLDEDILVVVEEFASSENTEDSLPDYSSALLDEINALRTSNGINALTYDQSLESTAKYLNDKDILEGQSLTNELFTEALTVYSVGGSSQTIGRTYNIWSAILNSILTEEEATLINPGWKRIGINIQIDNTGNIHTILVLNNS